jgi:murein DD-endopeptidase MepM/ murein hydrolase activator NlpD
LIATPGSADTQNSDTSGLTATPQSDGVLEPTAVEERPNYNPGELVDYIAQTGDTLPALAIYFNTSESEILEVNPVIPQDVTTLPPGFPMKIPIYFEPFWGSAYQIIPDSHFINGPVQISFDSQGYLDSSSGWLRSYTAYVSGKNRNGAEIIDFLAANFSLSPRLLLGLLEFQLGALSQSQPTQNIEEYPLGYQQRTHKGLYLQLVWAANELNRGYYGRRIGNLTFIEHLDGTIERPDPWQNAASVALHYYFSRTFDKDDYTRAISPEGFSNTYSNLFGNPWDEESAHIPGSLKQPEMRLPFEAGKTWAYTGGPHTGWGTGEPFAAIDFAPPSTTSGCFPSSEWNTAVAAGVIARTNEGILELDLDGDGDTRTGWTVFYLHIATNDRLPVGTIVEAGDRIGHPSCEGGTSTGTHIHLARKYNGEWILADGPLAFNLEGWLVQRGEEAYLGTLTKFSEVVTACECANQESHITAESR